MDVRKLLLILLLATAMLLAFSIAAQKAYTNRRAQVEEMTPDQKAELAEHWDRFNELPREKRDQLRLLHTELETQPDRESLESALDRYRVWLETLPWYVKAELRALPTEERIKRIREIRDEQAVRDLSEEDRRALSDWLNRRLGEESAKIAEELRNPDLDPRKRGEKFEAFMRNYARIFRRRDEKEMEAVLADLREKLSPRVREIMEKKNTREQRGIVGGWIFGAFGPFSRGRIPFGGPGRAADDSELGRFYKSLSADEKQRLQEMRDEDSLRKLRELYGSRRGRGPDARRGRGRDFGGPRDHRGRRGSPDRTEGGPFSGPPREGGPPLGEGPPPGEGPFPGPVPPDQP